MHDTSDMRGIAEFLMREYYEKYDKKAKLPTLEQVMASLEHHKDNIIVVRDKSIIGVAVYLTLSDDTYRALGAIDMLNVEAMKELLEEQGDNYHFILVAGSGVKNILKGIKQVRDKAKTISWWNPDQTYLHTYNLN